ncbi:hypothetical protein SEA_HERCULESXL_42 [Microbacterium phage HerculesXL]|nr:hypothetical protein SEA_HERCULESXL_42 [Microbacterium phage HerculesXL]WNN95242.1 hypothetical protein SEA_TINYMAN4_41 [Microbacterium phage Tinyman4]
MSTRPSAEAHPHLGHLHTIGVLTSRTKRKATRAEAQAELDRYWDEGLSRQKGKKVTRNKPMTKSGFCAHPSNDDSHKKCRQEGCTCECHEYEQVFSGQGIIFAVIDDRENMRAGRVTTIDVITEAIEAALDAGHETSEEIARYITTSAFQHVRDRRVRFNSVLKAGDVVGAQITRKLYNSYNDLAKLADEEEDPKVKAEIKNEARGFAEAIQVVLSPFSSEDPKDPRLVDWDEVDRMTEAFEKEQRLVRRERKGNPQ